MSEAASPLLIGIDTGGTYTDAVVLDQQSRSVLAKAKAPTTHDDLAIGVGSALDAVLLAAEATPNRVGLVALSTTLATNALVESKGRRACLVAIGFDDASLERAGLRTSLGDDPLVVIAGGHTSHGNEIAELDLSALKTAIEPLVDEIDAVAICSQFSVRNPAHEIAARDLVRQLTGLPVTCSHELSSQLNGPKRAVTALLNARLIALIDELVTTTATIMANRGIDARLMVVRGDGSLVSEAFVRERPIETILSGPAASMIGAAYLTENADAMVVDIGGTTTDIAVVTNGVPDSSPDGAVVGGHHTMVDAVRIETHGLGGDSHVRQHPDRAGCALLLGPRKVTPLSQLAMVEDELVRSTLGRQGRADIARPLDAVFVSPVQRSMRTAQLGRHEKALLEVIGDRSHAVDQIVRSSVDERALDRLVARGFVRLAAFTPTDAAHILGLQSDLDTTTAHLAGEVVARTPDRFGQPIAADATQLATAVFATLVRRSAEAVLAAAFTHDQIAPTEVTGPLAQAALDRRVGVAKVSLGLTRTVIGLGAPAATYYPAVAALLGTDHVIPDHADVANAIGAAVGKVKVVTRLTVTAPRRGIFRLHTDQPYNLRDLDEAKAAAEAYLRDRTSTSMAAAGAAAFDVSVTWTEKTIDLEGRPLFVEGEMAVAAVGDPLLTKL